MSKLLVEIYYTTLRNCADPNKVGWTDEHKFVLDLPYKNEKFTLTVPEFVKYYDKIYSEKNEIADDFEFCENLFSQTNKRNKDLIDKFNTIREHTAMSVGDIVRIENNWYACKTVGFEKIEF